MKVGDMVKFKGENENETGAAIGLLVEVRNSISGTHGCYTS